MKTSRLTVSAAALALVLAGCGDGDSDTAASDETPTCPITATEIEAPACVGEDLATKPNVPASTAPKPT